MHIKSLILLSSDLDSIDEFYSNKLDFKTKRTNLSELIVLAGGTKLIFRKSRKQPYYHYCFLVPANKLKEALAWARKKIILIEIEGKYIVKSSSVWNAESFYFYDGNGNIAEFIAHYNLDNHAEDSFSAQSIISVNEIGCPSTDIPNLNGWLEKNVGSEFWTGETSRFGTNGNENGCFLLVNNEVKDTWFPTDKFPESAPFKMELKEGTSLFQLEFLDGKFKLI